jgi:hypothetical protein
MAILMSAQAAQAVNYVVTSVSNFESGNINQVLEQASATPGPHTITFDPAILPATFEPEHRSWRHRIRRHHWHRLRPLELRNSG